MDDMYANAPAAPGMEDERNYDADIISGIASRIIEDPNGMDTLISAAGNTPDPAKGVAQYLMMMFDSINTMLEQTGIPFDFGVITANGGVLDDIVPEIAEALAEAGVPVDEGFPQNLTNYFLEMLKAAAQSEQAGAPQPAASPTAGAGGLLESLPQAGAM